MQNNKLTALQLILIIVGTSVFTIGLALLIRYFTLEPGEQMWNFSNIVDTVLTGPNGETVHIRHPKGVDVGTEPIK